MRSRLKKIESVEAFSNFLDAGVDHVASQSAGNDDRSDDPTDMSAVDRPFDSKVSKKKKKKTELPVGTLEKMKDIQKDVEQIRNMLKTGLKNEDYYSTLPEDYSPI